MTRTASLAALATLLATALLLSTAASTAALAQDGPDELALTVYNNGLALVADTRRVELGAGEQVVELPGVSSEIQPTTVTFALPNAEILEQNFDYDLLSPQALMEKHVGEFIEVVRTNPGNGRVTRERARVLAVNNGVIVEIGNRIEVLREDDIPTRVVFSEVPENLRARPTLSIRVDSARAGSREAELSYLSGGLSWRSDYVANYDEAEGTLDLQGWATLTNTTETGFEDADVAVVAGGVASTAGGARGGPRFDQFGGQFRPPSNPRGGPIREAGTEDGGAERLGDNYIYPLPGRITVRANQTKQVGIVDAEGIPAAKSYTFRAFGFQSDESPQSVDVTVDFRNSNTALPAGTVRVYQRDASNRSQFVGEDEVGHVPGGSSLAVTLGTVFDVRVQPTVVRERNIGERVREITQRYRVSNAGADAVTVDIRQQLPAWAYADYEVLDETLGHEAVSASQLLWEVEVPARGETVLEFTVRERRR